ncbi:MAG: hypothetical protein R3A13_03550 [Bdellovibrionota bacterium]
MEGEDTKKCSWIRRPMIKPLARGSVNQREDSEISAKFNKYSKVEHDFKLYPDEWMKSFIEYRELDPKDIKQRIIERVRKEEEGFRKERAEKNWTVLGATKLKNQSILKKFKPKKWGKRMVCLSDDIELRREFLIIYKAACEKSREVYQKWKSGDFSVPFPAGMFTPRVPPRVSVLNVFY